jgi:putative membrane protein
MKARVLSSTVATILALSATSAFAGEYAKGDTSANNGNKEQTFIKEAIQGNLAEEKLGQLAQQKGQSEAVRSYGSSLEKDHTTANKDAMKAAQSLGVTAPSAPNEKQMSAYNDLSKMSGEKFDDAFVKAMVKDHKKDVKEYEQAAKNADNAAGSYASQTLPTLKMHLQMAQNIDSQMSKTNAVRDNGAPGATRTPATGPSTTPGTTPESSSLPPPR